MSGLKRVADRLKSLITRGRVQAAKAGAGESGRLIVEGMVTEELRFIQPYGLASRPAAGAEAIVIQLGSNSDEAIVIACDDRRYRVALTGGEVALYDDLGSKVHLKRGGEVEVEGMVVRLGKDATVGGARLGDDVTATPDWAAWFAQVELIKAPLLAAMIPPVPSLPVPPGALGTITTASTKVVME